MSCNKLLAKMASDFKKPDMVHTLYPEEIQSKMWPLPVSELFFVGRATAGKLFDVGIKTIGELATADPVWLKSILKKQGEVIWGFANGMDSVMRAAFLKQPIDHMSGGISREKRTVDYDRITIE